MDGKEEGNAQMEGSSRQGPDRLTTTKNGLFSLNADLEGKIMLERMLTINSGRASSRLCLCIVRIP